MHELHGLHGRTEDGVDLTQPFRAVQPAPERRATTIGIIARQVAGKTKLLDLR